jgi:hypothetical protein
LVPPPNKPHRSIGYRFIVKPEWAGKVDWSTLGLQLDQRNFDFTATIDGREVRFTNPGKSRAVIDISYCTIPHDPNGSGSGGSSGGDTGSTGSDSGSTGGTTSGGDTGSTGGTTTGGDTGSTGGTTTGGDTGSGSGTGTVGDTGSTGSDTGSTGGTTTGGTDTGSTGGSTDWDPTDNGGIFADGCSTDVQCGVN